MDGVKRGQHTPTRQPVLSTETIELLSQQATEKAQKDLLNQLKQLSLKKQNKGE